MSRFIVGTFFAACFPIRRVVLTLPVLAVAIVALPSAAPAARGQTLTVANDGVDSSTCGAEGNPCRSISQAIANAPEGMRIEVGPGVYGDLDRDGIPGETGEEFAPAGCHCLIHVDKRVEIVSRDGPAMTLIDGTGSSLHDLVRIEAGGAIFGGFRRGFGQGFMLTGAHRGVYVSGANDVLVAGNVAVGNESTGFANSRTASRTTFQGNLSVANVYDGFVTFESHWLENVAIANSWRGFAHLGSEARAEGNVALANEDWGFVFAGEAGSTFAGSNAAIGNGEAGFCVDPTLPEGSRIALSGGSAIGNGRWGIYAAIPGDYTRNNVFGNSLERGCGFLGYEVGTDASRSFWGLQGPGADPADETCGPVTAERPARRELKLQLRNLPLQ